jgi:hypothetical protein
LPSSNWTPSLCWRSVRYPHPSTRSQGWTLRENAGVGKVLTKKGQKKRKGIEC